MNPKQCPSTGGVHILRHRREDDDTPWRCTECGAECTAEWFESDD